MKFLVWFTFFLLISAPAQSDEWVTVDYVIDGDTFVTAGGKHVRLLGINAPERAKGTLPAQAFSKEAREFLTKKIEGKTVKLTFMPKKKDKYKRLLANIYTQNGEWVNGQLVAAGMAHVYSFPDTRGAHIPKLLKLEEEARLAKKGLWRSDAWAILQASAVDNFSPSVVGKFHLVEGTVQKVADVKGRLYLNFGDDWRTDFTAEIPPKYRHFFKNKGKYLGKKVRVRGVVKPVNGMMITLTHPEQLDFLE